MKVAVKKQGFGDWMSIERLQTKHAEFEQQLLVALKATVPDRELIKRLKRDKLTCKDLIAHKRKNRKVEKPAAEVVPLPKRKKPAESLFLGAPRAVRFAAK